ncbi:MAG: acyl-CoA synthetase [Geminicoccaceae bacterium]|nr:MAG: acyl-CoA synthetase [Geminicoccaceae bacterium]
MQAYRRAVFAATSPYERGLDQVEANFQPLTPLTFLDRAAATYPDRVAVRYAGSSTTYAELHDRCHRLAAGLAALGVQPGDTVAVLAPNVPALLEAHYGVPLAGAVLNALNTRLDARTIAYILAHGEAKVLLADTEYAPIIQAALADLEQPPIVVDIIDPAAPGARSGELDYDALLDRGDPAFTPYRPADEWQAIALNYTSGTTGQPKGVVYHHRGAYLNAVGNALVWDLGDAPVYLWTLPLFHCNGWCFPWTVTMKAGTHVCLRKLTAETILTTIAEEQVSHLCGAPIVMGLIAHADDALHAPITHSVRMMTAASAPPAAILERMADRGFHVTHVYGLTEVYGPATVCAWQTEWDGLDTTAKAAKLARQGVRYPVLEGLAVCDPATLEPLPHDGTSLGEIMMRGHIVMKGYLKDQAATAKAFAGGWFHTGDLAVTHEDGYIEIKDRSKDIIITGGENVSSIEVEGALYRHPAVLEAAVVARPDDRWGESPCAFVTLKPGATATAAELIAHCRQELALFKTPKTIVFKELPKTSTGKVQKNLLREEAERLNS